MIPRALRRAVPAVLALSCAVAAAAGGENTRLLWKVDVAGGSDRFVELLPAGDKLLALRKGLVQALDAATGRELWRFPEKGQASRYRGMGRTSPFMRGTLGDCLVTTLLEKERDPDAGLLYVGLADGKIKHTFRFGVDVPRLTVGRYTDLGWTQPAGKRMAFFTCDEKRERHQVSVIDLESRTEAARFEFPIISYRSGLRVVGDLVLGGMLTKKGEPSRVFSVNIKTGELYSLPIRGGYLRGLVRHVLPDGSQVIPEGRLNVKCGYERPWPKAGMARQFAGALYVRDERSLYRADPADGHELWRLTLPYYYMYRYRYRDHDQDFHVGSKDVVALHESGLIYVMNAADGKLRAVIRAMAPSAMKRGFSGSETLTAWDSERVYFSCLDGLRVFSARPVDPARPDPADCGDPAGYLARTRAALAAGQNEKALDEIRGIGVAVRLRPEQRREAAQLLSQLSRSPAARLNPRVWKQVLLADGPLAGELFLAEFQRLAEESSTAVAALIEVGTPRALEAAGKLVLGKYGTGDTIPMALEAIRLRTKRDPAEQIAATPGLRPWRAMQLLANGPLDEATFRRRLPMMRRCVPTKPRGKNEVRMSWGRPLRFLMPEQAAAVVEGSGRDDAIYYREACLEQAESRKKGEGRKQVIEVTKPKPPAEVF